MGVRSKILLWEPIHVSHSQELNLIRFHNYYCPLTNLLLNSQLRLNGKLTFINISFVFTFNKHFVYSLLVFYTYSKHKINKRDVYVLELKTVSSKKMYIF